MYKKKSYNNEKLSMEKMYVHDTELFVATNWGYQKVREKFGEKSLRKRNHFIDISSG